MKGFPYDISKDGIDVIAETTQDVLSNEYTTTERDETRLFKSDSKNDCQWSSRGNRSITSIQELCVPKSEFYISKPSCTNRSGRIKSLLSQLKTIRTKNGTSSQKKIHKRILNNKRETIEQYFCKKKNISFNIISPRKHSNSKQSNDSGKILNTTSVPKENKPNFSQNEPTFDINIALQLSSRSFDVKMNGFTSEESISESMPLKKCIHKNSATDDTRSLKNWISPNDFNVRNGTVKTITEKRTWITTSDENIRPNEPSKAIHKENYIISRKHEHSKSDWISRGQKTVKIDCSELSVTTDNLFIKDKESKRNYQSTDQSSSKKYSKNGVSSSQTQRMKLKRQKFPIVKDKKTQTTLYNFFERKYGNVLKEKNNWDEKKKIDCIMNQDKIGDNKVKESKWKSETKAQLTLDNIKKIERNLGNAVILEKRSLQNFLESEVLVDIHKSDNNNIIRSIVCNEKLNDCEKENISAAPGSLKQKMNDKFKINDYNSETRHPIGNKIYCNKKIPNSHSSNIIQEDIISSDSKNRESTTKNGEKTIDILNEKTEGNVWYAETNCLLNSENSREFKGIQQGFDSIDRIKENYMNPIYEYKTTDHEKSFTLNTSNHHNKLQKNVSKSDQCKCSSAVVDELGSKSYTIKEFTAENICTDKINYNIDIQNEEIAGSNSEQVKSFGLEAINKLHSPSSEISFNAFKKPYSPVLTEPVHQHYSRVVVGQNIEVEISEINSKHLNFDSIPEESQNEKISIHNRNEKDYDINIHNEETESSNSKLVECFFPEKTNMLKLPFSQISHDIFEEESSPILIDHDCPQYLKDIAGGKNSGQKKKTSRTAEINFKQSDYHLISEGSKNEHNSINKRDSMEYDIDIHNVETTLRNSKRTESLPPKKKNNLRDPLSKEGFNALKYVSSPILVDKDGHKTESSRTPEINFKHSDLVPEKSQNENISINKGNSMDYDIDIQNVETTLCNSQRGVSLPPIKKNMLLDPLSKSFDALKDVSSPILVDPECQQYLRDLIGETIKENKLNSLTSENNIEHANCFFPPEEKCLTTLTNSEDKNFLQFWENMLSQKPAEHSQNLYNFNYKEEQTQNTQNSELQKTSQEGSEIFQYILSQDCAESDSQINKALKNMNNLSQKIMEKRNSIFNSNLNGNKLLWMSLKIYTEYKERSILSKSHTSDTSACTKLAVLKKREGFVCRYKIIRIVDVESFMSDSCSNDTENSSLWNYNNTTRSTSEAEEKILLGLKDMCLNKSYLYVEKDDGPHEIINVRFDMIRKIGAIFEKILTDFDTDKSPYLEVRRQTFDECTFINDRLELKLEDKPKTIKVKYQNTSSQFKFCLMMYILAKVLQVLETNSKTTRRELYYQIKHLISNQSHIDRAVKAVSCMLCAGPWDLNIVAHKGMVFGDLKITMSSNEIVDCSLPGTLIPQDVDEIVELKSSAFFILVVEKESIFYKILEEKLPDKLVRPFVMLTGKGFPDLNTQLFLKKLWMVMSIPIFIFTDADPHGINIMMTYRFGSLANAHLSHQLAIPKARWLGVFPSEIVRLNADKQILSDVEKNVIRNLLKTPYMKVNRKIEEELKFMLESGYKAGIEGIIKNPSFLSEFYFPLKFHNKDLI